VIPLLVIILKLALKVLIRVLIVAWRTSRPLLSAREKLLLQPFAIIPRLLSLVWRAIVDALLIILLLLLFKPVLFCVLVKGVLGLSIARRERSATPAADKPALEMPLQVTWFACGGEPVGVVVLRCLPLAVKIVRPQKSLHGDDLGLLALLAVVVREARGRADAAVAVLASLFAAEGKESQGALELEDCLLEHAAAFLSR
jgi:hypothetical protein